MLRLDVTTPIPVAPPIPIAPPISTDWNLCIICQENLSEKLTNPSQNPKGDEGYDLPAKNLKAFQEIKALPVDIDIARLDDGAGLRDTFKNNSASWHRSCYLKFNNTKLYRAQAKSIKSNGILPSPKKTRKSCDTEYVPKTCIFCGLPGRRSDALSRVMSKECSNRIKECATVLRDSVILRKCNECIDLISLGAEYHNKCYTQYKNKSRNLEQSKYTQTFEKKQATDIALSEIVTYINEVKEEKEPNAPAPVFNMAELTRLYAVALNRLGVADVDVHSTRLKERLLDQCPHLQSHEKQGRESLITFKSDVESAVRTSLGDQNFDEDGKVLCDAAKIIRKNILSARERGNDANSCVPTSLLFFLNMLFNESSTDLSSETELDDQLVRSIGQQLVFHTVKKRKKGAARRHSRAQESPSPIYLAMKLYGETRKKKLVDLTYQLGMSISYDRLETTLTEIANEVCSLYHEAGVVCPPSLRPGIFTTAAVDNVDHNTSSTTACSSFHGTAVSLMQHHLPSDAGRERILPDIASGKGSKRARVMRLPDDYAIVEPCFTNIKNAQCPQTTKGTIQLPATHCRREPEKDWLAQSMGEDCQGWSSFHSAQNCDTVQHETTTSLLPKFYESAHSTAMMIHSIKVVLKAVHFLNPDQVHVIVADQPLFALLKSLQYVFPLKYGEDKIFVIMGGLHIEQAAMRAIGQWLPMGKNPENFFGMY